MSLFLKGKTGTHRPDLLSPYNTQLLLPNQMSEASETICYLSEVHYIELVRTAVIAFHLSNQLIFKMSGRTTKIHEAETFYLNFKLLFQTTHKYLTSSEKPTKQ